MEANDVPIRRSRRSRRGRRGRHRAVHHRRSKIPTGVGGSGPQPTASPSPTPSITPAPDAKPQPDRRYDRLEGLRLEPLRLLDRISADWRPEGASRDWVLATDRGSNLQDGQTDGFIGGPEGNQIRVRGFAADVPAGTSEDAWLSSYYAGGDYCPTTPAFVPVTIDGRPGRLDTCFDAQAFVFDGQRVYAFSIWAQNNQPLFRAFLSTVRLPASAPSGSPGASASP